MLNLRYNYLQGHSNRGIQFSTLPKCVFTYCLHTLGSIEDFTQGFKNIDQRMQRGCCPPNN